MRDRVREFLGVWAPMILGVILIALAVNYLLTPRAPPGPACEPFCVDPVAEVACGGGVVFVGIVLFVSTIGRWRKVRRTLPPKSGGA